MTEDMVNHPSHYTAYPVEVIDLAECLNYNRGNIVKYVSRAGLKGNGIASELEDLRKARWYIEREIHRAELRYAAQCDEADGESISADDLIGQMATGKTENGEVFKGADHKHSMAVTPAELHNMQAAEAESEPQGPGEVLDYWISESGYKYEEAAEQLGITVQELIKLLDNDLCIRGHLAGNLERLTEIKAEEWIRQDDAYQEWKEERALKDRVRKFASVPFEYGPSL